MKGVRIQDRFTARIYNTASMLEVGIPISFYPSWGEIAPLNYIVLLKILSPEEFPS